MISCRINSFFRRCVVVTPRANTARRFFESHSRGNRRIVLRNQPEYRGAYAFNRIVNPFLSSVRAEQLENCMQMQKYSGESPCARAVISYRFPTSALAPLLPYHPLRPLSDRSFTRFAIFRLLQCFRLLVFPSSFFFLHRSGAPRRVMRRERETKF